MLFKSDSLLKSNLTTHILNGDSLKEQFPATLSGEIIVARECLVEGDVSGITFDDVMKTRSSFMQKVYSISNQEYQEKSVSEFDLIRQISSGEVNLWFEEDLFCQVNLWFVCSLLERKAIETYLILPQADIQYGFGGMSKSDLEKAFQDRIPLKTSHLNVFAKLWIAYQHDNLTNLQEISDQLPTQLDFVSKAVQAHQNRLPYGSGLPEQTLNNIIKDLGTTDFIPLFKEFNKRLPIYGFGDAQVKHIIDSLS